MLLGIAIKFRQKNNNCLCIIASIFKQSSLCVFYIFIVDTLCKNIILDCGRVYIKNHVLTENIENATVGTAPWNVGIYHFNKQNSNYDLICGGSIISPNLVVSGKIFI